MSPDRNDDVIDEIPLLPQHFWQSLTAMVHVELEIPDLVLILYLVCKLQPDHVKFMMMLLIKFFSQSNISDKIWRK